MLTPRILVIGRFAPDDLLTRVSESTRRIDPLIENTIDQLWKAKTEGAARLGKNIYNGMLYRLNALRVEDQTLFLDLGTLEYKTREGLLQTPGHYGLDEAFYGKSCYTEAAVKTSDGRYLMVELSGKSMNDNRVDHLGGAMETTPKIETGKDIFHSLYKELEEEAHVTEADVLEAYLRCIYLGRKTSVGFYFEITLHVTSEELLTRSEGQKNDPGIKSLKTFTRSEYKDLLLTHTTNKQLIAGILSI